MSTWLIHVSDRNREYPGYSLAAGGGGTWGCQLLVLCERVRSENTPSGYSDMSIPLACLQPRSRLYLTTACCSVVPKNIKQVCSVYRIA